MTPRSIRRAAERKARKLARKAEKAILSQAAAIPEPDLEFTASLPEMPPEPPRPAVSAAQLAANQANARLSTGPRSNAGKEVSSLNALKTGLTGRTVLLPSEDVEQYQRHVGRFFAEYNPATDEERELVQCVADTAWRLLRIPALESALFALARVQFEDMFQDRAPELRASLIEAQALVAFQKQFMNLGIQEARLMRRFTKTRAELVEIQSRRRAAKPKPAAPNGFEFSSAPNASVENASVAHGLSVPERASARSAHASAPATTGWSAVAGLGGGVELS